MTELIETGVFVAPGSRRRDGISAAGEAYLTTVLELEESGIPPIRARIADQLGNSAPSTSQYIVKLEQAGLLRLEGHHRAPTLSLTPEGMQRALRALRQHRLAECYLHRIVGLSWVEVHGEACQWERVMSAAVTERFEELLGFPRHSPYGSPIPAVGDIEATYLYEYQDTSSLIDIAPHSGSPFLAELRWIGEPAQADQALLHALDRHGVLPGAKLFIEFDWEHARITSEADPKNPITLERASAAQLFIRLF